MTIVMAAVMAAVLAGCGVPTTTTTTTSHTAPSLTTPATSEDTAFLDAIHAHGLTSKNGDQAMVNLAHDFCGLLSEGGSVDGVADHAAMVEIKQLSHDDVRFYVQTAAAAYCPQYIK